MDVTALAPVIPVVTIDLPEHAAPIARALLEGGVGVIEVTLRTPGALAAIASIAAEVPDMVVGAGTVLNAAMADAAAAAGARFLVSPGTPPALLGALRATGLPFLPGVATATEAMSLYDEGITTMKFFPADAAGGTRYLASLAAPLPDLRFCPTGGITAQTAGDYLRLSNVPCIGGSWLTPTTAVRHHDWAQLTELAAASLRLA